MKNSWLTRENISIFLMNANKTLYSTQKMKFSTDDLFSKCDQIRKKLQIWSYLLKKSLMKNCIFCAVIFTTNIKPFLAIRHTNLVTVKVRY